jgi:ketosteroid isomerase-like protein
MNIAYAVVRIAALSCLLVVGCVKGDPQPTGQDQMATPEFDLSKLRTLIEVKNQRFTTAHVTGDRATIDDMFTDDAKVLPPNADPVIGRKAIDELTAEYIGYTISEFREETTDFYGNEQFLIDQGNYVLTYGKDSTVERGKYLNVWKMVDGEWKIYSNIWNANAPLLPSK